MIWLAAVMDKLPVATRSARFRTTAQSRSSTVLRTNRSCQHWPSHIFFRYFRGAGRSSSEAGLRGKANACDVCSRLPPNAHHSLYARGSALRTLRLTPIRTKMGSGVTPQNSLTSSHVKRQCSTPPALRSCPSWPSPWAWHSAA